MANEVRLIDANALVAFCKRTKVIEVFPNWKDMSALEHAAVIRFATKYREIISCAPTVDAEPVKHGRWLVRQYGNNPGDYACTCSECKTEGSILWKRCPLCEAKMDKEN